jgi:hypothetical protein
VSNRFPDSDKGVAVEIFGVVAEMRESQFPPYFLKILETDEDLQHDKPI